MAAERHGPTIIRLPSRGVRPWEGYAFGDGDVERGGDVADASEAGGAVAGGLVALDLLLGDAELLGELALRPAAGDLGPVT